MIVGGAVFGVGLVTTFLGASVRGRVVGLTVMAIGSVIVLAGAARPDRASWWTVVLTAVTLVGMVGFAVGLSRRLGAADEVDAAPGDAGDAPNIDRGGR